MAPTSPRLQRLKHLVQGRNRVWAAVAVLCVAGGAVGSVLGAHAVARSDAAEARQAFPRTSAGIASTLELAIQHDEDLIIGASTFFAGNPRASAAEFSAWVNWAQVLRRYPELEKLGFVALVRASELAAFEARIAGHALKPTLALRTSLRSAAILHGVPAGARPYSCLASVELARNPAEHTRTGRDYCAATPALLSSRDSRLSIYTPASVRRSQGLSVEAPVYSGNLPPATIVGRRAAFAGWLREVLVPGVVLQQALQGHPDYAVRLRYKAGPSNVVFTAGSSQPSAQSSAMNLHNGWTLRTSGPPPATASVLTDGGALALLIVGGLLSLLVGLLVFILGTGRRAQDAAPEIRKRPHSDLYDALTGLPNRALTLDRAERMVARTGRQSGMLAGALFIDIDWFKDVNDKLGRAAGDQLLRIVARTAGGRGARGGHRRSFAGDEFVVLVESAARGVRLDSLARRMIEALHKPVELDDFGPRFFSTASIGVAFGRYATPDDLLRDAQLALTAPRRRARTATRSSTRTCAR